MSRSYKQPSRTRKWKTKQRLYTVVKYMTHNERTTTTSFEYEKGKEKKSSWGKTCLAQTQKPTAVRKLTRNPELKNNPAVLSIEGRM